MKVGDRLTLNGQLVQVDSVLSNGNFAYHPVKETVAVPEESVLEEVPKKRSRRKA